MQRFFLPSSAKHGTEIIFSDKETLKQITHVLRVKPGDNALVLFNDGKEYLIEFSSFSKSEIHASILEEKENVNELSFELTLYQVLPKFKGTWELILQKATEIGVRKIVPILSSRSSAKYPANSDRIQKILQESAEQSERGYIPSLSDIVDITKNDISFLEDRVFLADSYDKNAENLFPLLREKKEKSFGVIIGPEGGFSEIEVCFFQKKGVKSISLGKRILRTETAALVSLGIIANAY